jgi:ABC-type proline/glycine betaine transport system permease subunit
MGLVLAVLCGMTFWAGAYIAITGRPVYKLFSVMPERLYLFPLLALAMIGWAWKMYIHLHGIDGWK